MGHAFCLPEKRGNDARPYFGAPISDLIVCEQNEVQKSTNCILGVPLILQDVVFYWNAQSNTKGENGKADVSPNSSWVDEVEQTFNNFVRKRKLLTSSASAVKAPKKNAKKTNKHEKRLFQKPFEALTSKTTLHAQHFMAIITLFLRKLPEPLLPVPVARKMEDILTSGPLTPTAKLRAIGKVFRETYSLANPREYASFQYLRQVLHQHHAELKTNEVEALVRAMLRDHRAPVEEYLIELLWPTADGEGKMKAGTAEADSTTPADERDNAVDGEAKALPQHLHDSNSETDSSPPKVVDRPTDVVKAGKQKKEDVANDECVRKNAAPPPAEKDCKVEEDAAGAQSQREDMSPHSSRTSDTHILEVEEHGDEVEAFHHVNGEHCGDVDGLDHDKSVECRVTQVGSESCAGPGEGTVDEEGPLQDVVESPTVSDGASCVDRRGGLAHAITDASGTEVCDVVQRGSREDRGCVELDNVVDTPDGGHYSTAAAKGKLRQANRPVHRDERLSASGDAASQIGGPLTATTASLTNNQFAPRKPRDKPRTGRSRKNLRVLTERHPQQVALLRAKQLFLAGGAGATELPSLPNQPASSPPGGELDDGDCCVSSVDPSSTRIAGGHTGVQYTAAEEQPLSPEGHLQSAAVFSNTDDNQDTRKCGPDNEWMAAQHLQLAFVQPLMEQMAQLRMQCDALSQQQLRSATEGETLQLVSNDIKLVKEALCQLTQSHAETVGDLLKLHGELKKLAKRETFELEKRHYCEEDLEARKTALEVLQRCTKLETQQYEDQQKVKSLTTKVRELTAKVDRSEKENLDLKMKLATAQRQTTLMREKLMSSGREDRSV
ncbi:uncharacterized protein TEOVI_000114900 [Trypanosoma equiperdum]|uniref:Uncharacterized protein n=1 Tax=Trypanosoma equiperdum TaxID=5694 RepID=A0A1G4IBQ9_TRYEQ|nr:hypothetical protein, conserved [Trypanosoma equiperdum]